MHSHRLNRSLITTSKNLRKWNRESFGFANIKIGELEKELNHFQKMDSDDQRQKHILKDL